MAINSNPTRALKHVATFTATGNYVVPQNTSIIFVSVHSSTGGSGGGGTPRYSGNGIPGSTFSGASGLGRVSGAFISVNPGGTYPVTIGAGGTAGAGAPGFNQTGGVGGTGGTTSFDSAISLAGSAGGGGGLRYASGPAGAGAPTATGSTSLTALPPAGAIVRTGTISNQTTGATSGTAGREQTNRYTVPGVAGAVGSAGIVHIYV
jgi:hypothetical protein